MTIEVTAPKPSAILGIRHLQVALLFLGLVVEYHFRVSLSVGIVAMTSEDATIADVPIFNWSKATQDIIISSFYWGYIISQVPAGVVAEKYGGKYPMLMSISGNAIFSLLIPISAVHYGWGGVCGCRIFQGLFQGFFYPSTHALLGKWAPPSERGRLSTFVYAGTQFGTVVAFPIVGELCGGSWGWPSAFYTVGILGFLWSTVWLLLGADSPAKAKYITEQEKLYIQTSLNQVGEKKKFKTPWKAILTCLPFWGVIFANCAQNWGFGTLLNEMPSYMKFVHNLDIKKNGLFSSLPYLAKWISSFVFGFTFDYIINHKIVSITNSRKLANTIGYWIPALTLVSLSYLPADFPTAISLLTITLGFNAGHYVGFQVNHMDLSPNFAGILMGITTACASIFSIFAPLYVGFVLTEENKHTAEGWRPIFFMSAAIYFFANLFFVIFGTSETQPWNDPDYNKTEENIEEAGTKEQPAVSTSADIKY